MKKADINHPNEIWFKIKTEELIKRDIRFTDKLDESSQEYSKMNKENDYLRCLIWEWRRTLFYEQANYRKEVSHIKKYGSEGTKLPFPYCIDTWPQKAYLSHEPSERVNWALESSDWELFGFPKNEFYSDSCDSKLSFDELTTENKRKPVTLFSPDTHTSASSQPIEFNGVKLSEVPFSTKVPVVFHLDVDLNKTKLKEAVNSRWPEIEAQILKAQIDRPTARFLHNRRTQIIKLLKTALTHLGLYRLIACCGKDLKWYQIMDVYGPCLASEKYGSDDLFRKEVKAVSGHLFPDLRNLKKIPLREI